MPFLFWLLWSLDLLFAIFVLLAADFRGEMSLSTGLHFWLLLGLLLVLVGGPILRFGFKLRWLSMAVVALPLVAGFIIYLMDKGRGNA